MNSKKIRIQSLLLSLVYLLTILSQPLKLNIIGEFVFIFSSFYLLFYIIKYKIINKKILWIILGFVIFCIIGLLSNIAYNSIGRIHAVINDIIIFSKVPISFCAFYLITNKMSFNNKIMTLKQCGSIAKYITVIAFICLIINFIHPIGMSSDIRYGIHSFKFIFNTAAWLNQYWVGIVIVLFANVHFNKKYTIYLFLANFIWIFSLRSRAFAMVSFNILLYILATKWKKIQYIKGKILKKRNILAFSCLGLFLGLFLGYRQIENYFFSEKISARLLLLNTGFKIMKDNFPLGVGFGMYGTEAAKKYYSPIYYTYGLSSFWALKEGGSELTDTFWPAIAAEFGFFGLVFYLIIIFMIFKLIIKNTKNQPYLSATVILYIIYLMISSTATGIFLSDLTVVYFIIICLVSNIKE